MELFLTSITALSACVTGAVALNERRLAARELATWRTLELHFPVAADSRAPLRFIEAISGLPRSATVVVEVTATPEGIRHRLGASQAVLDTLEGTLRAVLPGARVSEAEGEPPVPTRALVWRLAPRQGALRRTDGPALALEVLAALQPLGIGEALSLRLVLGPTLRPRLPQPRRGGSPVGLAGLLAPPEPDGDRIRALRHKYEEALVAGRIIAVASAVDRGRADHLLARLSTVLRTLGSPAGHVVARNLVGRSLSRLPGRRTLGLHPDVFAASELAGLLGWPTGQTQLPGLRLGSAPLLLPSKSIPTRGRRFARSNWPGLERDLAHSETAALSHTLVAGPTGSGKSALLTNLVVGDIERGRGVVVIDGKGDLASDVLARIPLRREADVVVLDLGAGGPVPGLALFGRGHDPELAADLVLGVVRGLFADSWGPRSEQWLRAGLVTVAHDPCATLADLPLLFADPAYRRRLVGQLRDPLLVATWQSFEAMGEAERANQLAAPLNKLGTILGRQRLRALLGQRQPALDLAQVLNASKVLVVSLAPGAVGAPAARLLGALVTYEVFKATSARARLAPARRRPAMVTIDEPQVLGDLPVPLDALFASARGLGVGITLAAQSVSQLPPATKRAALTNAATLVAFRQGADDARELARELGGISADALQALEQYEVVLRLGLGGGTVAPPVTGLTFPPPPVTSDPAALRAASAARYGVDPEEVDRDLFERHERGGGDGPVGRKGRVS